MSVILCLGVGASLRSSLAVRLFCVYVRLHVCASKKFCICVYRHFCMWVPLGVYLCICACISAYMYTFLFIYVKLYPCVFVSAFTMCLYRCMYPNIFVCAGNTICLFAYVSVFHCLFECVCMTHDSSNFIRVLLF